MRLGEKGASLVEAAVVLPFVVILVMGVADMARAFFDAAKVQEAAQEGAIYASLNPTMPADAATRALATIQNPDFTDSISVSCPDTDQVAVTVEYEFTLITPIIASIFGPTLTLDHTETAQILTSDNCVAWSP